MAGEVQVLHVAETLIGGIASHVEDVVRHQIGRYGKENVVVLVPRQHREFVAAIPDSCVVTFERERRGARAAWHLLSASRRLIATRRPKIVHLHSSVAGGVVRLLRLMLPLQPGKVVYCPHGWSFAADAAAPSKAAFAAVERLLSLVTASIITVSDHETRLGRRFGMPDRLMTTVYNGVASSGGASDVPHLPMMDGKLNLLFVGRLDRQKGFNYVLDAARELRGKPIQFHVCGSPVVSPAIDFGSIPENVTLHGWVKRETVLATMRVADALVLPSLWEGLSITGIEAMRAGLPIVASNRSSNPELVDHGITGLIVDVGEPGALARALSGLTRDQLRLMGAQGQLKFARQFTLELQVEKLSALYEAVNAR